jgi:hypothetical protein
MKIQIDDEDPRRLYDAIQYCISLGSTPDKWQIVLLKEALNAIDDRYPPHKEIIYRECENCHINIGTELDPIKNPKTGEDRWLCPVCMDFFDRTRWATEQQEPVPQPGELWDKPKKPQRLPGKEHRG